MAKSALTVKNIAKQELTRLIKEASEADALNKALTAFQEAAATSLDKSDKNTIRKAQYRIQILRNREAKASAASPPDNDDFDFFDDDYQTVDLKADAPVLFYPKTWRALGITAVTTGSLIATPALFVITLAAADWVTQGLHVTTQFTTDALKLFLGFNTSDPLITISGIVFVVAAAAIAWGAVTIYRSKQRKHPVDALQKQLNEQKTREQELQTEIERLRGQLTIGAPQDPNQHASTGSATDIRFSIRSRASSLSSRASSEDPAHAALME